VTSTKSARSESTCEPRWASRRYRIEATHATPPGASTIPRPSPLRRLLGDRGASRPERDASDRSSQPPDGKHRRSCDSIAKARVSLTPEKG
jgi:hypothetical protein